MKDSIEHINETTFRSTFDMNAEKRHQKDLGLTVPEGYFSQSKADILAMTTGQSKEVIPLYKRKITWISMAAAIALLLTLAVYNPFTKTDDVESDVLIASLFTEEESVDDFVNDFVNDELLTEDVFTE